MWTRILNTVVAIVVSTIIDKIIASRSKHVATED